MGVKTLHNQELLKKLGSIIRAIRAQKGLTQQIFAKKTGFAVSYIGGVERGERNLSFLALVQIVRELDIALSELLEGIK